MGTIAKEVAQKEVNSWLEFKKVDQTKIDDSEEVIEALVNGFINGYLTLSKETMVINHKLKFPVLKTTELNYKPRVKMSEIDAKTQNQKSGGGTNKILRPYICAVTETNSAVIAELDTEDNRIATGIATFFL